MSDNAYAEKDMVRVVNAAGQVQPDPVPKAWLDTELVPEGTKQATDAQVKKAEEQAKADSDARSAS